MLADGLPNRNVRPRVALPMLHRNSWDSFRGFPYRYLGYFVKICRNRPKFSGRPVVH
jgi:hypothetical protein